MGSFYCLMAVVELGDYAADKLRWMSPIGSLRHLLIRGIDFLRVPVCAHVCLGVYMYVCFAIECAR